MKARISLAFFSAVLLAACGDTVENVNQMGMDVVDSVADLPECTSKNEGEQAFVKGETSARICVDGEWYATVSGGDSDFSCKTEELKDKSGLKIICNGDSIGVVLNGSEGKQGEAGEAGEKGDNGGCTFEKTETTLTIDCGNKAMKFTIADDGSLVGGEEVVLDSEMVAVSLDSLVGYTQKGPFIRGATVYLYELSDGRTLKQTSGNFTSNITRDDGYYKFSARDLVSQYAMVVAEGYYRNEVTGYPSDAQLRLKALTDMRKHSSVNVNLLSHLEYDRVYYLVTREKMTVKKAKQQAQKEILRQFHIELDGNTDAEAMDVFGLSDADAALLAVSVMLQGDRPVAKFSELLTKISSDIEKDSAWKDADTKKEIAQWCANADSSGRLDTIRQNVEGWKLSLMVPKFEKHVRHFWNTEYGLGDCTTNKNGDVVKATKGMAGEKTRYICKEIGEGSGDYRWVIASDFEKDTYKWKKDTTDGALKDGTVTGKKYVFDKTGSFNGTKGWREAVAVENVYGGCTEALYDSIRTYSGTREAGFYQCQKKTHTWILTKNNLMIDTQGWKEGDDGFSKWGDSIGVVPNTGSRICYVYDTSAAYNGWRTGNVNDCSLNIMGCTKGRAGTMTVATDGKFYNCANNIWTEVVDPVLRNTKNWDCKDSNAGEMKLGKVDDIYFVCNANTWRKASLDEEKACRVDGVCRLCTEGMQGQTENREGVMYVCDKKNWREFNCAEKKRGVCTTNDSSLVEACETVGAFEIDYTCSDDHWHAVQHPFEYTLAQWNAKREAFNAAAVDAGVNSDSMITDPRDLKTYRTVVINNKRVFAENLRYADSVTSVNLKGQTRCYNNDPKNCEIGGRYYTWTAAVNLNSQWQSASTSGLIGEQHQGICPDGWHIPNNTEWNALISGVGYAAQQAMGYSGWTAATDATGFSALPVGNYYGGNFDYVGSGALFWSATEYGSDYADRWYLYAGDASLGNYKYYGFAVRCFQDTP